MDKRKSLFVTLVFLGVLLFPGLAVDTTKPEGSVTCSGSIVVTGKDNAGLYSVILYDNNQGSGYGTYAVNNSPYNNSGWVVALPNDMRDHTYGAWFNDTSGNVYNTVSNCSYSAPGFSLKRAGDQTAGFLSAITDPLPSFMLATVLAVNVVILVGAVTFAVKKFAGKIGK